MEDDDEDYNENPDTTRELLEALRAAVVYLLECSHRECDYCDFHGQDLLKAIQAIKLPEA